jgi:hypothetical protein
VVTVRTRYVVVGLLILAALLWGLWFLATEPTPITDRIDPQPNLTEEVDDE